MDKKVKCNIVQFLFNSARGSWAEEVQKLYEQNNKNEIEIRTLHDELAKMRAIYLENL